MPRFGRVLAVGVGLVSMMSGCFGSAETLGGEGAGAGGQRIDPTTVPRTPEECATNPVRDPGNRKLRRLNRDEFDNTVRDLLGDTTRPGANVFPADDFGYGFDNIADVLTTAPLLVEKYEAVSEALIRAAWLADATRIGTSGAKLRVCRPASETDSACHRQILEAFGRKAWRRPLSGEETNRLLSFVTMAKGQGDSADEGLQLALTATLMSPNFNYMVEFDDAPDEPVKHALTSHELATRLSFFLWSSTPDAELSALADSGALLDGAVLEVQVKRMLADVRAETLITRFAGQWLKLGAVPTIAPDNTLFPGIDANMKAAFLGESQAFLKSIFQENRSYLNLLDADYTYLNDRLAGFYGLPAPGTGDTFTRVQLPAGGQRGGLLTQASVLAVTSHPDHTSPVLRGKWVLANLLCSDPPPPPPSVEANLGQVGENQTTREKLAEHRANPVCASCHQLLDPIGLGLENFDAVGRWRDTENGKPVDASGELPNGDKFNGARELSNILKLDQRISSCLTKKLYTYAVGRGDLENQACSVFASSDAFVKGGYSVPALVQAIVRSEPFRERRGQGATP